MEPLEKQHKDAVAVMLEGTKCPPKKKGVTGEWVPASGDFSQAGRVGIAQLGTQLGAEFFSSLCSSLSCPGRIMEHLQRTLQRPISWRLTSPMALPQCCTGG